MRLMTGESTLSSGIPAGLTLTTHRVRHDRVTSGGSAVTSLTLDAVASCAVVSKSHPILLLLAAFAAAASFFFVRSEDGSSQSGMVYVLLLLAVVLLLAYFLSRSVALALRSAGDSIVVGVTGTKPDELRSLIDEIERAKLRYLGKIVTPQTPGS